MPCYDVYYDGDTLYDEIPVYIVKCIRFSEKPLSTPYLPPITTITDMLICKGYYVP
jgi:hypothetical protein